MLCLNSLLYSFVIHLQSATMSSKLQIKPLLAKSHLTSEHSIICNNKQNYSQYDYELETNLRIILKRFNNLDQSKVRNLLEQLDNNLDLAINILQEEIQSSNKILEEKRQEGKKALSLTQEQENRILKQSFLNLYKKFALMKKENEELAKKNESYMHEIEKVKCMNKLLLQREYSHISIEESRDIY